MTQLGLMSREQLEGLLGMQAGSMTQVAWIAVQQLAQGIPVDVLAVSLGVEAPELEEHLEDVFSDPAIAVNMLKASAITNQNMLATGWDAIEAQAVGKLARSLQDMKTNGKPMEMLQIATQANKAIRRVSGENGSRRADAGGGASIQLNAGDIGTMTLTLSSATSKQLQETAQNRVINGRPSAKASGTLQKLQMLSLSETRELVQEEKEHELADVSDFLILDEDENGEEIDELS